MNGVLNGCKFFNISFDTWGRIRVGVVLELKRDQGNKYDKNAIQVLFEGKQIAWVDKKDAIELAPVMDKGNMVNAMVTRMFGEPLDRPHIEVEYKMGEQVNG